MTQEEFDPREAAAFQSIMLLRIYDVLLASLKLVNPSVAQQVVNLHTQGQTLGPPPYLAQDAFKQDD